MNINKYFDNFKTEKSHELKQLRISANETAIVPFTKDIEEVVLHYCEDPGLKGYHHCNGENCIVCRIGVQKERRVLLPVYAPTEEAISVLVISPNMRPYSLAPQLIPLLNSDQELILFVSRVDNTKYKVESSKFSDSIDSGDAVIKEFRHRYIEGNLAEIFPRYDNEILAGIQSVDRMMKLKGLKL